MRDEVLMDLVDKAMNDPRFRSRAGEDLGGTLSEYGYELTEEEMAAVREFHAQTEGMTDEEVDRALADSAAGRRQFGG